MDLNKNKLVISLSWKYISIALTLIILVMLILWKPWQASTVASRKITVTGETTLKAEPDEYVLYPYFEFTNADRVKANNDLTEKSTELTTKLKELGVEDKQIKSSTSGYDKYVPSGTSSDNTLTLSLTLTLQDKSIAQKAQDYLLSVNAKGQISPQAQFSSEKQKTLQAEARSKAIEDAKKNAESTAKQFSAKVGKVVTITDGAGAGGPIAFSTMGAAGAMDVKEGTVTSMSLPVQVGQNEYHYSVSVEYELK